MIVFVCVFVCMRICVCVCVLLYQNFAPNRTKTRKYFRARDDVVLKPMESNHRKRALLCFCYEITSFHLYCRSHRHRKPCFALFVRRTILSIQKHKAKLSSYLDIDEMFKSAECYATNVILCLSLSLFLFRPLPHSCCAQHCFKRNT